MKQEQVEAYINSINVQDKQSYRMSINACVKFFDERGIEQPTVEDWQVLSESLKAEGKSDTTVKQNYVGRAKKFYDWSAGQCVEPVMPVIQSEKPSTLRVNFTLQTKKHEILALFMALEHKTLTDILNEAVDLYIKEHSEDLKKKLSTALDGVQSL